MSATSALDEMLSMVKRRALEITALPIDRREGRYELIHDATRRASISIGQQPSMQLQQQPASLNSCGQLWGSWTQELEPMDQLPGSA